MFGSFNFVQAVGHAADAGNGRKMEDLLKMAVGIGASDVHLTAGVPPVLRVEGKVWRLPDLASSGPEKVKARVADFLSEKPKWGNHVTPALVESFTADLLAREHHRTLFERQGEVRFALSMPGLSRFRVSIFRQRGCPAINIRMLGRGVPDLDALFEPLPEVREALSRLVQAEGGLIIIAGPAGSGKSTTLAALIDCINRTRALHVVTIENPVEYLHVHAKSVVNQREVGEDVESVAAGVVAAVAADADVVAAAGVPDGPAADAVIAAAEAGKLVFCEVRASSLGDAVFALADLAGTAAVPQRLASVLRAVVFQKTVPRCDRTGHVTVAGVYPLSRAARLVIRNGDRERVAASIRGGGIARPLEHLLAGLVASGLVSPEDAEEYSDDPDLFWQFASSASSS